MTEFKIDPSRYMHLSPEEARRQMAEDERRHINANPGLQAHIRDMKRRQEQADAEKQREAVRLEDLKTQKFNEAFDAHYQDRLAFYSNKGVPQAVFDEAMWPELARQFLAGEEDAVDRERRERSTNAY